MASCKSSSDIKRKNVTTACAPCRISKIKCDGLSPACTSCMLKDRDCHYARQYDRRKLSLRNVIEILAERVTQLSDFIQDNSLEAPDMDKKDEAVVMKSLCQAQTRLLRRRKKFSRETTPTVSQNYDASLSTPPASYAGRHSQSLSDTQPLEPSPFRDGDGNDNSATARHKHSKVNSAFSLYPNQGFSDSGLVDGSRSLDVGSMGYAPCNSHDVCWGGMPDFLSPELMAESWARIPPGAGSQTPIDDSDDSEVVHRLADQLSDRVGSLNIGKDGQIRHHGPTSNFNLVHMPEPDKLTIHRTVRDHGQQCLSALGLGQAVPSELVEHLTNLFFAWQNPILCIVNRPVFEKARMSWGIKAQVTQYFSEALMNSVCAAGATFESRHSPSLDTFPRSLSDFFADRAKALLEIELDDPTVATVQTMVILTSHEIGCKRDTRGWLYSGMAVRLAFDLALHLDLSQEVEKGFIPQQEANLRRDVFWSAYNSDCMWKYSVGRPCYINLGDVTIARPADGTDDDIVEEWAPYTGRGSLTCSITLPDFAKEVHRQRTILCEILAPLMYGLYGRHNVPLSAIQNLSAGYSEALQNWLDSLPSSLKVDVDDIQAKHPPHVLLLQ
ncbi:hypothetical protein FDECE_8295 [Fusarium decemcellulare]|nr:hypothetical protein FDECE_8295 [Fusarium decemcellulare]